jgi:hypothetical protein
MADKESLKNVERTEDKVFELCTGQCLKRLVLKNQRAMGMSLISDLNTVVLQYY